MIDAANFIAGSSASATLLCAGSRNRAPYPCRRARYEEAGQGVYELFALMPGGMVAQRKLCGRPWQEDDE